MKKVNIAVVCLILALSIVGCGQSQNNRNNTGTQPMNQTKSQPMNQTKSNIDTYDDNTNANNHNHGEHQTYLNQHISSVEGVKDSTVLVDDQNIIVGLDVDNEANRAQIENSVRSMLLKDHNGQNVHVTSDTKFHDRIRTLSKQMNPMDGQPIKSMANDIKTLLDDIGKSINNTVNNVNNNTMK